MSPRWRGLPRGAESPDGNDSTLVGRSLPRQRRLSVRTAASSVSTTLSSEPALALVAAAAMARRTVLRALGIVRQRGDSTRMSIAGPCTDFFAARARAMINPWLRVQTDGQPFVQSFVLGPRASARR